MKKIFTLFAVAATLSANAQNQPFEANKFFDNWSLGINIGGSSPVKDSHIAVSNNQAYRVVDGFSWDALRKNTRLVWGVELSKQWTPIYATAIEGNAYVNTTGSYTAFDNYSVLLTNKVNFSNLFFGYNGKPRFFEVEGVAGAGFGQNIAGGVFDSHYFTSKLGLNFLFNLGNSKAWTLALKPAIVYNLDGEYYAGDPKLAHFTDHENGQYNINDARVELTAGLTYHFKSSNGYHYFTNVRPYDQAEVDGLNAQINSLRGQLGDKDAQLGNANRQISDLQNQLNAARNQKPQVIEKKSDKKSLESVVTFRQGKSVIDASQLPNVERVATFLKNNPNAKVVILGYASPEGPADLNQRLSVARANAVKDMLVKKYKIAVSRISASGQGVGNLFSEPDWNRVAISTIEESSK